MIALPRASAEVAGVQTGQGGGLASRPTVYGDTQAPLLLLPLPRPQAGHCEMLPVPPACRQRDPVHSLQRRPHAARWCAPHPILCCALLPALAPQPDCGPAKVGAFPQHGRLPLAGM